MPIKSFVIRIVLAILTLGLSLPVTGVAGREMVFKTLADIESQAMVFHRDRDGFIWIGTYVDGLYRFDGKRLKHYVSASEFIRSNNIPAILEDREGRLWFASAGGGLTRFDKDTDTVTHFTHDPENPSSISSDSFFWNGKNCLDQDRAGFLWVGTIGGGLNRFDDKTDTFKSFRHDPGNRLSIASDNVRAVLADSRGAVWAGTEKGLSRMDKNQSGFRAMPLVPGETAPKLVMAVFEDSRGQIWAGTENNGLYRYDGTRFTAFRSDPDDENSIGADRIVHITELGDGRLLISHEDRSSLYLPGENRFIRLAGPDTDLTMAFSDPATGRVWGLTDRGKLMVYNPHAMLFRQYDARPGTREGLSSEVVVSIFEGSRGALWISTLKGFNKYDPATGRFTHFFHDPGDPGSIPSTADYSPGIFEDSFGTLWIGSSVPSALSVFDRDKEKIVKTYYPDPGDPDSLPDGQQINRMIQDRDDPRIMWISTAKGLVRFDTRTEKFTTFGHDNSWSLMDDGQGIIWLSTWGRGLGRFDKNSAAFTYLRHDPNDAKSISDNLLVPIFTASDGRIWVGTENGLNRFDRETKRFQRFRRKDGYPFDAVHSIGEAPGGALWLGTNQGLVRFEPSTGKARAFTREDGVQSVMFYANNGITSKSGEMWFGGTRGMTSFFPGDLKTNTHIPAVKLCELRQGGAPMPAGRAPERLESITLDWRQNFFEFEFAAFDYANPKKNQYAFMLEGFDKDWFYSGHNNFGRYSGLPPGRYRLKLKGSNNDGIWNEEGTGIIVHVRPPFWQTGWFYTLLGSGALFILGIIIFYLVRLNREVRERKTAQADLRQSNRRLRQLDRLKDEFLANTSHELRTPLTGIIGLSESLLDGSAGPVPPGAQKDLAMIIASGRRLASLVNDILDFSKLRHKDLKLKIRPVDLKSLTDVVLAISAPLTAGKPLALENRIPGGLPLALGDEDRIQQILFNLVGNAVKFTPEGHVAVTASVKDGLLETRVMDTGIGIPREKHGTIFESFEQVDGSSEREFSGTGLGLAVSKQLVELHGGTIGLASRPNAGSEFFFTLPTAPEESRRPPAAPALFKLMDLEKDEIQYTGPDQKIDLPGTAADLPHILVVDDEAVNLRVLSNQLSTANYRVTQVSSGPDALKALDKTAGQGDAFDLILLDVMMPRMSGYEVCRKLREKYPRDRLPVVMLTAKNRAEDLAAGLAAGANDYLTKPFNKTELLARIKSHRELKTLIQKREESQAALAVSEEKFRSLFNNLVDAFFRTDAQGRISLVSPSFEKVTGVPPDQAVGMHLSQILDIRPEDRKRFIGQLEKNGELEGFELSLKHQKGHRVTVVTSARYYREDEEAPPAGVEGIFRDITQQKELEKQLIQSQKMEAIGTLAGGIAHDFNNILAAILGNAELGVMKNPQGPNRERFDKVIKASIRARDLVSQILDFSRQTKVNPTPVKLSRIAKEVTKLLRASLPSTIEIRTRIDSEASVMADPTQIHQVLMNLGTNAAYAMKENGGTLTISLGETSHAPSMVPPSGKPGRFIRLSVKDTGTGMPPEVMGWIFDPFFTTKPKGQGTGMGLAVAHGIITRYKGGITVDSTPGKGTRFDIFLPVLEGTVQDESDARSPLLPGGKERILFVDDEPFQTELFTEMLGNLGYRVTAETDSRKALEIFRRSPDRFDAVVTDMTMPGLPGDRLSREMLTLRPDIPILLCTGYSDRISRETALKMGIRAYARKPLGMAEMARHLREILD
ncbi:MAG: response regulator [Desulfobacter sp.]|nr:MAG: response regulator [Desulfobacter sp.]